MCNDFDKELIFKQKYQSNISNFPLLSCTDLLFFYILYDSKLIIWGFGLENARMLLPLIELFENITSFFLFFIMALGFFSTRKIQNKMQ